MSRPYVRKSHPQQGQHCCEECEGAGQTQALDYDEHGAIRFNVRCEACLGLGFVTDCDRCDEVSPVPELEQNGGFCNACAAGLERADADAEIARIRRAS